MNAKWVSRRGYTLIELLVVMAIIGFLAALTAIFFPTFQGKQTVTNAAGNLSSWLLIAKQQARRDGLPTGVRFTVGPNNFVSQMQYVQQPDDFAIGLYTGAVGASPSFTAGFSGVDFRNQYSLAGWPDAFQVLPGDYLEIYGGGPLRRIVTIDQTTGTTLTVDSTNSPPLPSSSAPVSPVLSTNTPVNYRVIPQPRLQPGSAALTFPSGAAIDFNTSSAVGNSSLSNVPSRSDSLGNTYYEIMFAPSGAVLSQGSVVGGMTGQGLLYCWVRDPSANISANLLAGNPQLIVIYPRTGFIAAQPVAPGSDPYLFIKDARSSGM